MACDDRGNTEKSGLDIARDTASGILKRAEKAI